VVTASRAAFALFVETHGAENDRAVDRPTGHRDVPSAFHEFPAEQRKHIRTTHPIESTFATVRHRAGRTRGHPNRKTGLAMAFVPMMSARGKWPERDGPYRLPEVIRGMDFVDAVEQMETVARSGRHQLSGMALPDLRAGETGTLACMFSHPFGQGRKCIDKGDSLGHLRIGGLRRVRIVGDHLLDTGLLRVGDGLWRFVGHDGLLSLRLAGRMEITESPCVPSAANTTARVSSFRRPITMCPPLPL